MFPRNIVAESATSLCTFLSKRKHLTRPANFPASSDVTCLAVGEAIFPIRKHQLPIMPQQQIPLPGGFIHRVTEIAAHIFRLAGIPRIRRFPKDLHHEIRRHHPHALSKWMIDMYQDQRRATSRVPGYFPGFGAPRTPGAFAEARTDSQAEMVSARVIGSTRADEESVSLDLSQPLLCRISPSLAPLRRVGCVGLGPDCGR